MSFEAPRQNRKKLAFIAALVLGLGAVLLLLPSGEKNSAPLHVDNALGTALESNVATPTPPATPDLQPAGVEDIDFKSYSTERASHIGLELGQTRLDIIDQIRLYLSPEAGANIVQLTSSTFELKDGSVMLFARNNLPDDAVFAEEIYAIFSGSGEVNKYNQTLAAYGLRVKCRRGKNAMEWTTKLCP